MKNLKDVNKPVVVILFSVEIAIDGEKIQLTLEVIRDKTIMIITPHLDLFKVLLQLDVWDFEDRAPINLPILARHWSMQIEPMIISKRVMSIDIF